jgi:uncharacterized glyoxalase superfamily protein PhnB
MTKPTPIPEGYTSVTPFLAMANAREVIDFAVAAFDATELFAMTMDDGSIGHAEIQIGDSKVMIGQVPDPAHAFPSMLHLYVEDIDAVYAQAVKAGGETVREPTNQDYGDRNAAVKGPGGNQWWIASRVEIVEHDEIQKRMKARDS